MNAHFKIAVIALCGMLPGLPAAQAEAQSLIKNLYVELGTAEGDLTAYPKDMTLKVGESYRLVIVNWNQEYRHAVMAPEFGRAIITEEIRTFPQRVEMPGASFGNGIDLPPGARVEMYFVPQKEGRYKLFCQDQVHTRAGMEVAIDVRR